MVVFKRVSVESQDAVTLLNELNDTLMGILGHNGTMHVCMDDFKLERAFFLIGYDVDEPMCCAGVRCMDDKTGEVKRVYARENKKGLGAALMRALEREARVEGYERLALECRAGNTHAIEFYKRNGYIVCDSYPPYDEEDDAVCLDKKL